MTILTNFIPRRRLISDITVATQAVVTTTEDHGYSVDQLLRIIVPEDYGMKLDSVISKVVEVPTDDTFTLDLDTSDQAAFSAPSFPPVFTDAQSVPITGTTLNNTTITG